MTPALPGKALQYITTQRCCTAHNGKTSSHKTYYQSLAKLRTALDKACRPDQEQRLFQRLVILLRTDHGGTNDSSCPSTKSAQKQHNHRQQATPVVTHLFDMLSSSKLNRNSPPNTKSRLRTSLLAASWPDCDVLTAAALKPQYIPM